MKETTNKVRILLIGLSYWARSEAHFPAILRAIQSKRSVTLCACVDLKSGRDRILAELLGNDEEVTTYKRIREAQKTANTPELVWLDDKDGNANSSLSESHQSRLDGLVTKYGINAVIVSTRVHQHYLAWALSRSGANGEKLNVLVDKPFTTRSNLTSSTSAAGDLMKDINELITVHRQEFRIFMLGCQKRYQAPYVGLLRMIGKVHSKTCYPITHIYAETADGLWWLPGERAQLRDDFGPETGYTPGKLNDSGYHMIDIATWLLRHTFAGELKATVTTRMFRASDSHALVQRLREWDPENIIVRYVASEMQSDQLTKEAGKDIAESIQVDLDDGKNLVCQFQFRFEHDFASNRELPVGPNRIFFGTELPPPLADLKQRDRERRGKELVRQRNKREYLLIKQGPFAYYELRRVAKMGAAVDDAFGGNNHLEVRYFVNPDLASEIGCSPIGTVEAAVRAEPSARATVQQEDQYPTLEFIEAVESGRENSELVSPVADHEWALRIYAAAYNSGSQNGKPDATVNLDQAGPRPTIKATLESVDRLAEMLSGNEE